jgi:large subunit ribosomal protein L14e
MSAIEIGRVCVKNAGREKGKKCVVVDIVDKSYVVITGPKEITGVKRRRVNVQHIKPTEAKIQIDKGASDKEIIKALKNKEKPEKTRSKNKKKPAKKKGGK